MVDKEQPGMTELTGIEDYGENDQEPSLTAKEGSGMNKPDAYGDRTDGGITGGTDFGTGAAEAAGRGGDTDDRQRAYNESYEDTTANAGKGEMFGEWENSGVGTDLTQEMEGTDVRSGLVKGGEHGAADVAGLGQYGGQTGSVEDKS